MSYYVIGEPEFAAGSWYKSILDGLVNEKRQRRVSLIFLDSLDGIDTLEADDADVAFVIGGESDWLDSVTERLARVFGNRVIVLGNCERRGARSSYSVVTLDIQSSVRMLCDYLSEQGRRRIALYGINPDSASDAYKKEAFLSLGFSPDALFYNNGSISDCADAFLSACDRYDGIICVNSYAAVSLSRRIADKDICVTAIGGSLLAELVPFDIVHTECDYTAFAAAGIELSRLLIKDSHISSVTVCLTSGFCGERAEAAPLHVDSTAVQGMRGDVKFYSDSEMGEMLRLENMLSSATRDDMDIIRMLLDGHTYQSIAEAHYMSTGGIKYKLKNMFDACGVKGRDELLLLLQKYMK